jgi:hypothetical protein
MISGAWQAKEIRGMIRTLAVYYTPILDWSKDDGKTPAETASNEMVMGAVQAVCEFSLLVSQQSHCDISLTALDNALKRNYKEKGAFWDQKMLKSGKGKVDKQLAIESHKLQE